jgi:hypothetical protein
MPFTPFESNKRRIDPVDRAWGARADGNKSHGRHVMQVCLAPTKTSSTEPLGPGCCTLVKRWGAGGGKRTHALYAADHSSRLGKRDTLRTSFDDPFSGPR